MGPQFFETKMGVVYYQNTMMRIAKSLERIASVLEEVNEREKQEEKEESYSEEKEDHDNPCPWCGRPLITVIGAGVRCPSDECGYWFCQ